LFAGNIQPTKYIYARVHNWGWSKAAAAENENELLSGKFHEHCWCDGSGYGPCEFWNSNCTGSVGIYGVWKANKFWCGCTKYLCMEFHILSE